MYFTLEVNNDGPKEKRNKEKCVSGRLHSGGYLLRVSAKNS